MFKLERSMTQARKLATQDPDRFQVGSNGWVTARFTTENPLPKSIWEKWLQESYESTGDSSPKGRAKTAQKTPAKSSGKNETSAATDQRDW